MGHNGAAAVNGPGIVPAFVKHPHIDPQMVGQVYGPAHGPFVGADGHEAAFICFQGMAAMAKQGPYKRVSGHKVIEAV